MSEPFVINVADARAVRHEGSDGASAAESTDDPRTAYADWSDEFEETKLPWPPP